ncbi:MBL fold metallo-hydrolase [Nocardioides sp. CCNWLW239]|uniref:MBL fold metallo-hydrolase n=1 Tax=Nocardioides sp. CCNWLW239 TaxID=3128902 RepID=UPI00301B2370
MTDEQTTPTSSRTLSRRAALAIATLPLAGACAARSPAEARPSSAGSSPRRRDAQAYYAYAADLAGDDPVLLDVVRAQRAGWMPPEAPDPRPVRIFDDVAVVGTDFVQATALATSAGVVLIDALESPAEAEGVLAAGLGEVGMDPARVGSVIVAHGHADHFGGAQFFADRYGARVLMSRSDWDLAATKSPETAPERDIEILHDQTIRSGTTSIRLPITPGHTRGTVSPIFPVHWRGRRHRAILWGGMGLPQSVQGRRAYLASVQRTARRARREGIDVVLTNHTNVERLATMDDSGENPYILGRARTDRFWAVLEAMVRGRIADGT